MNTYYHVTPYKNIDSIMRHGLIPTIGCLSEKAGETLAAVYLFHDIVSAEDAIMNWYGDEFDDDEKFAIIQINLPHTQQKHIEHCESVGYESRYLGIIHTKWIASIHILA